MFVPDLKQHLDLLKRKDEKDIKDVEGRLKGKTKLNKRFNHRVKDVRVAMASHEFFIADVLKDYLDNILAEWLFKKPFSLPMVVSVLQDEEFLAFLISSHLVKRTVNLNYSSRGEVKLRVYTAILNYDSYKKQKRCE